MSNLDGFGAVVYVDAGGRIMPRQLTGGTNAHSQDFSELHFGLGDRSVDQITVRRPSGQVTEITDDSSNTTLVVQE